MAHHTVLFHLRLNKGQSIGPSALRKLWSTACGSDDVSVSRTTYGSDYGGAGNTYSLYGPPGIANLQGIETRLRQIFAEMSSGTISLTSL
jgi:hypothetical protein